MLLTEKFINKFKKVLTVFITVTLLLGNTTSYALALEAPSAPTPPSAPSAPTAPPAPTAPSDPTPPSAPTPPTAPTPRPTRTPSPSSAPTAPPAPTAPSAPTTTPSGTPSDTGNGAGSTQNASPTPGSGSNASVLGGTNLSGGQDSSGGVGGASINTGDAVSSGTLSTDANSNLSAVIPAGLGDGSVSIVNSGNGTDSTNSGSATVTNSTDTTQVNSAVVNNSLTQGAITGNNTVDKNTGGTAAITTGDALATGTIINGVNTNVNGVAVAQFNVLNDQTGDVILNFPAGCQTGCGTDSTSIANTGNSAGSTNTGSANLTADNSTVQINDAIITNGMTLKANSGDNSTSKNTGGNSSITTGAADVAANILNFANNNIAGGVAYAVVNVLGNLIGNIILPESAFTQCCGAVNTTLANTGNGADSTNTTNLNQTTVDSVGQFNTANIQNNLTVGATSGNNDVSKNTGGNSSVTTGATSVNAQVLNVGNMNLLGGNYWLVIVNEAGHWMGRILGSPDGSNTGGSTAFEFTVAPSGEINVTNSGNGAGSTNTTTVNETTNNSTLQTNNANIVNNLNLSANTGGNSASKNTNGNSNITTGDAAIMANIVNFVNNNIVGSGKLFVTMVNVFGSWLGDFVGPGFTEPAAQTAQDNSSNQQNQVATESNNNFGSQNGSSSSGNTSGTQTTQTPESHSGAFLAGNFSGAQVFIGGSRVLAESTTAAKPASNGKKKVNINLAWALVGLFPLGLTSMVIRRRYHV